MLRSRTKNVFFHAFFTALQLFVGRNPKTTVPTGPRGTGPEIAVKLEEIGLLNRCPDLGDSTWDLILEVIVKDL